MTATPEQPDEPTDDRDPAAGTDADTEQDMEQADTANGERPPADDEA